MTPPRVSTPRVASYVEAHALTESNGTLACQIAMDLIDARDRIAELEAVVLNECGEGEPPSPGWTYEARTSRDGFGAVLHRYHAWLFGPDDTGYEVRREAGGGWSVALETDRVSLYPTARAAMMAADAARVAG